MKKARNTESQVFQILRESLQLPRMIPQRHTRRPGDGVGDRRGPQGQHLVDRGIGVPAVKQGDGG